MGLKSSRVPNVLEPEFSFTFISSSLTCVSSEAKRGLINRQWQIEQKEDQNCQLVASLDFSGRTLSSLTSEAPQRCQRVGTRGGACRAPRWDKTVTTVTRMGILTARLGNPSRVRTGGRTARRTPPGTVHTPENYGRGGMESPNVATVPRFSTRRTAISCARSRA